MQLVFVYGSLLSGEENHHALGATARRIGAACTARGYELFDLGPFPAMRAGGHDSVSGELYAVDAPTLAQIDRLEEHPDVYARSPVILSDGSVVQAYLLRDPAGDRPRIPLGDFRAWRTARGTAG